MFGVYYTLEQITGKPATIPDLTHALAKLRRSDVIRWLAALSSRIGAENGMDLDYQLQLAESILPDDLVTGLQAHLRTVPDVPGWVFHRRQLWFLLQMAVLSCKEDTPERPDAEVRPEVARTCLMASDILHRIDPKEGPGDGVAEVNRWMASVVIPILDAKDRCEVLARAQAFWFDLQSNPVLRKKVGELGVKDFDAAFTQKYGVRLREFFLILLSVYSGFGAHQSRSQNPLLLDETTYLRPSFSEDDIRRMLDAVSQTPDELACKLLSEARQNWAMDFAPLRGTPVIHVFPGKYACPDLGLLYRWMLDGVYFMLQKAYPEGQFAQLFGYVFEEYVHGLFREFCSESEILVRDFYASPKFRGTTDQAGDGIIHRGDTALLMEYKARRLTTLEKFGGVRAKTLKGIDDILFRDKEGGTKGVAQLAKNLARILRGERIAAGAGEGLDLSGCKHLFPVIVAYEEAVALEAVRQEADAKLRLALDKERASADRVGPLLVLNIDEVEMLEDLAHRRAPLAVIHEYVDYLRENPKDRAGSFRSFVTNRGYGDDQEPGRSLVQRTFHRAMELAGEEIGARQQAAPPAA
jgi:hypothetical protein